MTAQGLTAGITVRDLGRFALVERDYTPPVRLGP